MSMHRRVFASLSAVALALVTACGSSTGTSGDHPAAPLDKDGHGSAIVVANETPTDVWPNDPITIDAARVVADSLIANVSHGGGCADHTYGLLISSIWMESFPVQVPARLSHDAHGDNCRALLRRELHISLRPLADAYRTAYKEDHGTVVVRLAGSASGLVYRF